LLAVVLLLNALVAGLRRWGETRHARPAAADGLVGAQP
jgi:tungstate transport system permease protein